MLMLVLILVKLVLVLVRLELVLVVLVMLVIDDGGIGLLYYTIGFHVFFSIFFKFSYMLHIHQAILYDFWDFDEFSIISRVLTILRWIFGVPTEVLTK